MRISLAVPPIVGMPAVLTEAGDRFVKALERNPRRFLELHGMELLPQHERRRMTPRRPERLEAIALVGLALLRHADLISYRVGSPRSDGHVTAPGQRVINDDGTETGLCVETGLSITRLRRAIRDGRLAGYWDGPGRGSKIRQPVTEYVNAAGAKAYCAHRVVYRLTDKFFQRLGLAKRMERERKHAVERRAERRRRIYAGALLEGREFARAMRAGSRETRRHGDAGAPTRGVSEPSRGTPPASADAADNAARMLSVVKLGLRRKHPDWGAARLEAEAGRLLKPPPGR